MKTNSCADIRKTRPFLRKTLCQALTLAGLLGSLCAMPAFADDAADVSKLLKGGHFSEALTKANAVLAQKPRDAQLRFLKGVALTEMNKPSEAIAIFARLSEDFPDLPEPHNNLAVLYASSGQFDKARASLDMAMRTNPSYATALENLGDVNARIASQAYDKALQLDSRNASANAKSKLTLLTALGNGSKAASASATAVVAAPAVAPVAATAAKPPVHVVPAPVPVPAVVAKVVPPAPVPQPAVVAKPVTPPAPVVVASVTPVAKPVPVQTAPAVAAKPVMPPAAAVATVVPAPKPVAAQPVAAPPAPMAVVKAPVPTAPASVATVVPASKPVPVVPAPVAVAKPVPAAPVAAAKPAVDPAVAKAAKTLENDKEDVLRVVNAWARAWSARDVGNYLEFYSHDFQTPGGMSRKAWNEERYARIKGKGRISVSIENPQVTINDKAATVVFRQVYVSDRMRANGRKTLLLVKQGGKWQIKQERAAS